MADITPATLQDSQKTFNLLEEKFLEYLISRLNSNSEETFLVINRSTGITRSPYRFGSNTYAFKVELRNKTALDKPVTLVDFKWFDEGHYSQAVAFNVMWGLVERWIDLWTRDSTAGLSSGEQTDIRQRTLWVWRVTGGSYVPGSNKEGAAAQSKRGETVETVISPLRYEMGPPATKDVPKGILEAEVKNVEKRLDHHYGKGKW